MYTVYCRWMFSGVTVHIGTASTIPSALYTAVCHTTTGWPGWPTITGLDRWINQHLAHDIPNQACTVGLNTSYWHFVNEN